MITADWCAVGNGVTICGTRMREVSRALEREAWCFGCRKRTQHERVISVPDGISYYGPSVWIECGSCHLTDGDLFPGRYREWMEDL